MELVQLGGKSTSYLNSEEPENEWRLVTLGNVEATKESLKKEPNSTMSNKVVTALYTWYNFLFLNLWKQLHRRQNCYFILISMMQAITVISITNGNPTVLVALIPLLIITGILDFREDQNRKRADHAENVSVAHRVNVVSGEIEDIKWVDITVGDVIEIRNRELIPSDVVILKSSEDSGLCYVMTANLDGETNLKLRQVNSAMKNIKFKQNSTLICELPNNHLGSFEGTITNISNGESYSLTNQNFLLRGTQLRNTSYIHGLVTFVGRETKIQMNAAQTPHKMSSLTKLGNTETVVIFFVQCMFCLLCGIIAAINANKNIVRENEWIWGDDRPDSASTSFLIKFFTYMLIFTNFIPIAHVVQLDLAKLFQSALMRQDLNCYHEVIDVYGNKTEFPLDARSAELNEELGMVEYVFSDKTGTLTCNVMEFRKCSIGGISYGLGTTEIGRAYRTRNNMPIPPEPIRPIDEPNTPYVNFIDPAMTGILRDKAHPKAQLVHDFFLSLALNHEVMPEENNGEIILSASNPDEAALVYAAKHCGRGFYKRVRAEHEELTLDIECEDVTFKLLHNLEFSSERKRSSVIVQMVDGTIMLFCKGADNVILDLLSKDVKMNDPNLIETTKEHLLEYVNDGLRTLLVAQTVIPTEVYHQWAKRMHEADVALTKRQEARFKVMADIEKELILVGATAIEDKLQDGVGDAISSLRLGGVKVWMLTGDKVGTAENIGFSCELITKEMLSLRFVGNEKGQISEINSNIKLSGLENISSLNIHDKTELIRLQLNDLIKEVDQVFIENPKREACLIVDTDALTALEQSMENDIEVGKLFIMLSDKVKSVICARVSPKQKARVVKMVRNASPKLVTLSIGDGANDVPMIQTAHVGIGIYGLEGRQAVNASDYAIGQFRFLKTLLLVHGRWNHRRCAILTNYLFYKNSVLVLPNFFLGFYCLMSGSFFYYDTFYQFFNTFFTSLPILYLASLDQDVKADIAIARPSIYQDGIERVYITHKIFWKWMIEGMYSGAIVFFFPIAMFGYFNCVSNGQVIGFWDLGLEICYWTGIECLCFFLSLVPGLWGLWYYFSSQVDFTPPGLLSSYRIYGTYEFLFDTRMFWLSILLCTVICLIPVFTYMGIKTSSYPTRSDIGREMSIGWFNGVKNKMS